MQILRSFAHECLIFYPIKQKIVWSHAALNHLGSQVNIVSSQYRHSFSLGVVLHWNSVIMPFLATCKTYLYNIFPADNVNFFLGKVEKV